MRITRLIYLIYRNFQTHSLFRPISLPNQPGILDFPFVNPAENASLFDRTDQGGALCNAR